jgi:hypothetical protein
MLLLVPEVMICVVSGKQIQARFRKHLCMCEPTRLGPHAFLDGSNVLIAARNTFIRKLVATSDADLYRSQAQPSRRV